MSFVYDVTTGEWLQSIALKQVKPLTRNGDVAVSAITELPRIVLLKNKLDRASRFTRFLPSFF